MAFEKMVFNKIETRAVLPDGRVITASYSFPLGVDYREYCRIDGALRRAFGNFGSRTEGTPI